MSTRRRDKDQHAVDDRLGGQSAVIEILPKPRERADALLPRQRRANNPSAHDQPDGGEGADTLADLDQQDQLYSRHGDEEEEEASHERVMSFESDFGPAATNPSLQVRGILKVLSS